jgi:phosphoglycolate phosphatase-like HAD superfamily hydrolase
MIISSHREVDYLFFDFDGVIANSVEAKIGVYVEAFASIGLKGTNIEISLAQTTSLSRRDRILLALETIDKLSYDEGVVLKIDSLIKHSLSRMIFPLVEGVDLFFKRQGTSFRSVIISSAEPVSALSTLRYWGLAEFFERFYFDVPSKFELFTKLKDDIDTEIIVSVGDTNNDALVAQNSGIPYWHIGNEPPLNLASVGWSRDFHAFEEFAAKHV